MKRVAIYQMDIKLAKPKENVEKCLEVIDEATSKNCDLLIFPELCITGYTFFSIEEVRKYAEPIDGPSITKLSEKCKKNKIHVVVGMLEEYGEKVYNSAVLIGPNGEIIDIYRKVHLPFIGADRYVESGDSVGKVVETSIGNICLSICYDLRFPELARAGALNGADILIAINNWSIGAEVIPEVLVPARAAENMIYVLAANRVGVEKGATFIGNSIIAGPTSEVLAKGSFDGEDLIIQEIEPSITRNKKRIVVPGKYETDIWTDRKPELYGEVCKKQI